MHLCPTVLDAICHLTSLSSRILKTKYSGDSCASTHLVLGLFQVATGPQGQAKSVADFSFIFPSAQLFS